MITLSTFYLKVLLLGMMAVSILLTVPPGGNFLPETAQEIPWQGEEVKLYPGQTINMLETPNGPVYLIALNESELPNEGEIYYHIGGKKPTRWSIEGLTNKPQYLPLKPGTDNLTVANTSPNDSTPICVSLFFSAGSEYDTLVGDGQKFPIAPMQILKGISPNGWARCSICNPGQYSIFCLYIGNSANIYRVNSNKPGRHSTDQNCITIQKPFKGNTLCILNLSALTGTGSYIQLQPL